MIASLPCSSSKASSCLLPVLRAVLFAITSSNQRPNRLSAKQIALPCKHVTGQRNNWYVQAQYVILFFESSALLDNPISKANSFKNNPSYTSISYIPSIYLFLCLIVFLPFVNQLHSISCSCKSIALSLLLAKLHRAACKRAPWWIVEGQPLHALIPLPMMIVIFIFNLSFEREVPKISFLPNNPF